jgi:sigma-B regulation protein RsbU (phosphoserine phosphatase)
LHRLTQLVEATKIINSALEEEALLSAILRVARQELEVERGTLYFVDAVKGELWSRIASGMDSMEIRLPMGQGLAGSVATTGQPILIDDAYADPRFDRSSDERTGFRTRSVLCTAIRNRAGKVVGVLQLINRKAGCFSDEDLAFLNSLSDHMALAIDNTLLHRTKLERDRMERELRLGRDIQSRLFPEPPDTILGLEVAALCVPCYEVGGDCYDFIALEGGRLGFSIGDISGKGVSAALVMSSLQTALRMAAPLTPDLPRLMEQLNHLIHGLTAGRKYATFFYGVLDPVRGSLDYVNAGHIPPLLVRQGEAQELGSTGLPIGLFPANPLRMERVQLEPGDTLLLCTDGILEAGDPTQDDFGEARWKAMASGLGGQSAGRALDHVFQAVHDFENGIPPGDDKTVVVLHRH